MRQTISLAGPWQFQLDPAGTATVTTISPNRELPVPLPWQAADPDLQQYSGFAWYRRSIELDTAWLDGELLLHFGAVDYWCQVFVNGQFVGEHEGGYTPFSFPIRRYVQAGANEVAVRVYDSAQTHMLVERWPTYSDQGTASEPPFDANHIPHGKQEWYINVGGIWQDVTLTMVPLTYINHVHLTPNIHSGETQLAIELGGDSTTLTTTQIVVDVQDAVASVGQANIPLTSGQQRYDGSVSINQPHLWHMDDPYLYTANIRLTTPAGDDELTVRFGYRELTMADGQLILNGEPFFLLSALDQDLYPHTIYTVPSEEYLRDQFHKAKELGLNSLRCHIKPPDPRYLDLADEMGLLIWVEIPSWRTFYPKGTVHPHQLLLDDNIKKRVEQTLQAMIHRDYNHPSLMIWTIVNEDWGTSLPLSASDRKWVAEMYVRCKQLDPTRLVVDNSACPHSWGPNVHVQSDLDDFHIYANVPDQAKNFEQAIEQFNLRPLWTYSQHGDAVRTGQEPLILSEFGNWGLPSLTLLREGYGGDPPWFKIGPWWSPWDGEPGWAEGVAERFQQLGLDKIWGDYETFATATQWHQWAAMKWEIETMRRQPALAGYVITEFTDAYWESNGLLDFLRNPKVYHNLFAQINAPDVVIPQAECYSWWDDQEASVCVHVAHYGTTAWHDVQLAWNIAGTELGGTLAVGSLEPGSVRDLGGQHFPLPTVAQTQTVTLQLMLRNGDGMELARNGLDLVVFPHADRKTRSETPLVVIGRSTGFGLASLDTITGPLEVLGSETLGVGGVSEVPPADLDDEVGTKGWEKAIQQLGYRTSNRLTAQTKIAVTNHPTAELLAWVRAGGDLLFISTGASPFFWVQGRGGAYSGSWITSFSWLRPDIHRRVKVANPLSLPFINVMPKGTILGLPVENRAVQGDFLAGSVAGWIRHPAVHTVQFRYGQGRVIMTTFALEQALLDDPIAVALFHDLIDHLQSDACQPTLTAEVGSKR